MGPTLRQDRDGPPECRGDRRPRARREGHLAGEAGGLEAVAEGERQLAAELRRKRVGAAQDEVEAALAHQAVELERAEAGELDLDGETGALLALRSAAALALGRQEDLQ